MDAFGRGVGVHVCGVTCEQQRQIRADGASPLHRQWFYFRVTGARGVALRMRLINAHAASYPKAWDGYHAAYSSDRQTWLREPRTRYVDGELVR